VEHEKDDGVNKGVVSNDGSPGDRWLGIAMEVVPGIVGEKGSGEAINNSFVSMVRCWRGALCWGPSKCCTPCGGLTSQSSSSSSEKRSSSILEAGASPQLTK
jgi:hypothetical protein